jgi:hypothetical protein
MYKFTVILCSLALLTATVTFAQTKPAFDVATIKPAPPMDMAKVAAALSKCRVPPRGLPVPRTEVA